MRGTDRSVTVSWPEVGQLTVTVSVDDSSERQIPRTSTDLAGFRSPSGQKPVTPRSLPESFGSSLRDSRP